MLKIQEIHCIKQQMIMKKGAQLDRGEGIDGKEFFEELRQGKYD